MGFKFIFCKERGQEELKIFRLEQKLGGTCFKFFVILKKKWSKYCSDIGKIWGQYTVNAMASYSKASTKNEVN